MLSKFVNKLGRSLVTRPTKILRYKDSIHIVIKNSIRIPHESFYKEKTTYRTCVVIYNEDGSFYLKPTN